MKYFHSFMTLILTYFLPEGHPRVKHPWSTSLQEERFIWDRTPYDQIVCYETRCHLEDRYHHGNPHPGDTTYHLGDNTYHHGNRPNHPSERSNLRLEVSSQHCSQCDCDPYNAYNTSQYTCRAQVGLTLIIYFISILIIFYIYFISILYLFYIYLISIIYLFVYFQTFTFHTTRFHTNIYI